MKSLSSNQKTIVYCTLIAALAAIIVAAIASGNTDAVLGAISAITTAAIIYMVFVIFK